MKTKLFKLCSGIDIIAQVKEGIDNVWHFPFILTSMQTPQGTGYNLVNFITTHKELTKKVEIKNLDTFVMVHFVPDQYFINLHLRIVEKLKLQMSGIVAPTPQEKSRLITQ